MNDIDKLLLLNKKVEQKTAKSNQLVQENDSYNVQTNPYPVTEVKPYSAEEEMKRIKSISENKQKIDVSHSKIPKDILESIISQPLNVQPVDSKMDKMEQMLSEKLNPKLMGLNKSVQLIEKLNSNNKKEESNVKQQAYVSPQEATNHVIVDYSLIKQIVETAVENKFNELNKSDNSLPILKYMVFGDKFQFIDMENNVFECQMIHKGKIKRKR